MRRRQSAFTLVELLVVVAIIALLISILLPALDKARLVVRTTVCQANLRQIGVWGLTYTNAYNGWLPTRGESSPGTGYYWAEISSSDWETKAVNDGFFVKGKKAGTIMHCPVATPQILPLRSGSRGITYGLNENLGGARVALSTGEPFWPKVSLLNARVVWFGDARVFWNLSQNGWDYHPTMAMPKNTVVSQTWPWNWVEPGTTQAGFQTFPGWQTHPNQSNNFVFGDGHVEGIPQSDILQMNSVQLKELRGAP